MRLGVVILLAVAMPVILAAGEVTTAAQRKMAVGLAVAHLRAEMRKFPQSALPGIDYDHPQVLARNARGGRRLIFVSFNSKLANWGEYVAFEVCAHSSRVVRVDTGRLNDVALYRRMLATSDAATPNRLPSMCLPASR